jgi:hypothetical protein
MPLFQSLPKFLEDLTQHEKNDVSIKKILGATNAGTVGDAIKMIANAGLGGNKEPSPSKSPEAIQPINPIVDNGAYNPQLMARNANAGGTGINRGGVDTGYGKVIEGVNQTVIPQRDVANEDNVLYGELQQGTPEQRAVAYAKLTQKPSSGMTFDQRVALKKIGQAKELTPIDIITYDPKDPSIQRKVGTFMGRSGMGPRLIPFDNSLTEGQSQAIASQDVAIGNLTKLKDIMGAGQISKAGMLIAQKMPNSAIFNAAVDAAHALGQITDDEADALQEFKAEFDSAKQNIAVSRGGKALTATELELILNTLPQAYQNPSVWDNIVNRYASEFNTYRSSLKGGKSSVTPVKANTQTPETKNNDPLGIR